jgi:predicted nucleic acid-binding protein
MGSLNLPSSGVVYVDTSPIIYGIEKHPRFFPAWEPLWDAVEFGNIQLVTSHLTILESLVVPLKQKNSVMVALFKQTLMASELQLLPITIEIVEAAADLRADFNLKTPDAIHAATALKAGASLFITNDGAFRRVTGLSVTVLHEIF